MELEQLQRAIEAILFAAGERVEASRLAYALETDQGEIIAAADDLANVAASALIVVPCGASQTVTVSNTGAAAITVNAASLVITSTFQAGRRGQGEFLEIFAV